MTTSARFSLGFAAALALLVSPVRAAEPAADVQITIRGMVCSFCAQGLQKVFGAEKGIEKVDVSLDDKTISLRLAPGAKYDDAKLTALVNDAGYDVVRIERPGAGK